MTKFEDLKNFFIDDSPDYCNKKGLGVLIDRLWLYHKTKKDKDQLISKLNKYKKNNTEDKWYSLYAEIHSLYLINKDLTNNNFAVFSKEDNNDLILFEGGVSKNIEVKSISFKRFEKKYNALWNKLENISSGKAIKFTIKNLRNMNNILKEVEKLEKEGINNYDGQNIKIEVIKDIENKNETALVGQPIVGWILTENLGDLIIRKIEDKNNQIEKADIIIFYLHDSTYDLEDLCETLKRASNKVPILKDKIIKCFTKWNRGELINVQYNSSRFI